MSQKVTFMTSDVWRPITRAESEAMSKEAWMAWLDATALEKCRLRVTIELGDSPFEAQRLIIIARAEEGVRKSCEKFMESTL